MSKRIWIGAVIALVVIVGLALFIFAGKNTSLPQGSNSSHGSAQELLNNAAALEQKNEWQQAKELYQKLIAEYSDFKDIAQVQKKSEDLNMKIIFSGIETPQTVIHEVKAGDSLAKIAKQYNTTIELIKRSNGLTSDMIRAGQRLRIWTGVFSVFVDKSQNILILKCNDEVVKVYQVATGANNITPVGTFTVINKLTNPSWYKSGAVIPPGSPENILGTRWLGFDIAGYGIHGTTDPQSIGQQLTAGCVRMRNEEVEELYSLLPAGTQVTIID